MAETPLELAVPAKALAHWLATGLPLVLATPVLGLLLNSSAATLGGGADAAGGTPALTFIGHDGAAVTVTLRRGGLLLPVLVLPLAIPVLIFGVAASQAARGPLPFGAPFSILVRALAGQLVIGPSPPPRSLAARPGTDGMT